MNYVVAIEPGDAENPDFGVIIPDLPGCCSQGDDLDQAIRNATEAAGLWLDTAFDEGRSAPKATPFATLYAEHPEWRDWIWAAVDVDLSKLSDKAERITITIPQRVLRRLDATARAAGDSRSGYITRMVMSGNWS